MRLTCLALFALLTTTLSAQERLPQIPAAKLTDAQKKALVDYKDLRKVDLGPGPFAVLLRVPDYVVPTLQMRLHNINNSALSQRLTELAIVISSRHWNNQFEWASHWDSSVKAGLTEATLNAIAQGRRPDVLTEEEALVYDFCTELLANRAVSDATYNKTAAKLGEPGVVELTALQGYYAMLALTMNVARTPAPAGNPHILQPLH